MRRRARGLATARAGRLARAVAGLLGVAAIAIRPVPIGAQELAGGAEAGEGTVVVLVRHAERADDDPRDPTLTETGRARAEGLALLLRDAGLTAIWSTDYRRTRETASPVAEATGLEVRLYDPRGEEALAALADTLRATPGRHLVVGHSNTTPALVRALGGDPGADIAEDEYDRLYVLTLGPDGTVATTLLRVGAGGG
jgi:broad specificity phosphatase PhoE